MKESLDPNEDAELRRLGKLAGFGAVTSSITSRYSELRVRDRRKAVRDPHEQSVAVPVEHGLWGDLPSAKAPASEPKQSVTTDPELASVELAATSPPPVRPDPDAKRARGDSREIFAQRPAARGIRGRFRRGI